MTNDFLQQRIDMVRLQLQNRGIENSTVLKAMAEIPRELFVDEEYWELSYDDSALPISHGQTISQPYMVAFVAASAELQPDSRCLEIGAGSGYQAAILSRLCKEVYAIEIIHELAEKAQKVFDQLGLKNIHLRSGDGYHGWPEAAPFEAIFLSAAPQTIPTPLLSQVKLHGKIIAPVGGPYNQRLVRMVKTSEGFSSKDLFAVKYVPMTGKATT